MAAVTLESPEMVASAIVQLLKKKGAIDFDDVFDKRLWDGRVHVRRNASLVLALGGTIPPGKEALLPIAGKDGDATVRLNVVTALAVHDLTPSIAIPALLVGLIDTESAVSDAALKSLMGIAAGGAEGVYEGLVEALDDRRPYVQVTVVDLLVRQGAKGVDALLAGLRSPRSLVRKGARQCLRMLGGLAVDALITALSDDQLRDPVKRILDDVPLQKEQQKALEKLVTDGAPVVQMVARRLLQGASERRVKAAEEILSAIPKVDVEGFYEAVFDDKAIKAAAKSADSMTMVRALGDARPVARENAAALLAAAGLGDSQREVVIPKLLSAAKDDNPNVRRHLVTILTAAGGELAADSVALAAGDSDPEVKRTALEGLGKLAASEPESLLDALGHNVPDVTRQAVSEALRQAGAASASVLAEALDDVRESIRVASAMILGEQGPDARKVLPNLIEALEDDFEEQRIQAVLAVGRVAEEGDAAALEATRRLFEDSSAAVRKAASWAEARLLGRPEPLGNLEARELPSADFADVLLEEAALQKMAKSLDAALLGQLLFDGRPICRANAARSLGQLGKASHAYIQQLCVALKDGDSQVVVAAAEALGHLKVEPQPVVPALTLALKGADEEVAAALLGAIGGFAKKAVEPIVGLLAERPERVVGPIARVGRAHTKTFLSPLADALTSDALNVLARENAADVIADLGDEAAGAQSALIKALEQQSVLFRVKIIRALGRSGEPDDGLKETLTELAESDKRLSIQDAVEDALRMLRSRARLREAAKGGSKKGKKK